MILQCQGMDKGMLLDAGGSMTYGTSMVFISHA